MTYPAGNDLRSPLPTDRTFAAVTVEGDGFTLVPTGAKTFIPSGAPVVLYDVRIANSTERVGIASLIAEPDPLRVARVGNVCAQIAESHSDPTLLSRVAEALLRYAFAHGITTPLMVVPTGEEGSISAAASLEPSRRSELAGPHPLTVFEYRPGVAA